MDLRVSKHVVVTTSTIGTKLIYLVITRRWYIEEVEQFSAMKTDDIHTELIPRFCPSVLAWPHSPRLSVRHIRFAVLLTPTWLLHLLQGHEGGLPTYITYEKSLSISLTMTMELLR